jgi:dTDP-4-amino-4,6-dideoxygalactose transaminase
VTPSLVTEESGRSHDIPFFAPDVDLGDRLAVGSVLRSGWLTSGPKVSQFETEFAAVVGAGHAVAVSSCTAALQIALACWHVGPGDEVLIPTMTFASAAEVVLHAGATPVLVDVREDDLTIDVDHARSLVTDKTRVIMPMHYGGQPYDVDAVHTLATANGLLVLDDAAHALPAGTTRGMVGALADITCFSFYANKPLTTGEGGMLVTDRPEWAGLCKSLSLHGLSDGAWSRFERGGSWDYDIVRLGYKSNLTDMAAAMGLSQLGRMPSTHARRRDVAEHYSQRLTELEGVDPLANHEDRDSAWHLYVVRLDHRIYNRNEVSRRLAERGIGTSLHYKPLHRHSLISSTLEIAVGDYPNANKAYQEILSLPLFPAMTLDDADHVVAALRQLGVQGAT